MNVRSRGVAATLVGALLMAVGAMLPSAGSAVAAATASSAVTVPGPPVWQPSTQTYGKPGSVTVSQVKNLTDQSVQVSWSGFTPSRTIATQDSPTYVLPGDGTVLYPVRVYECRGADPQFTDCYGSPLYGANPAKGWMQTPPTKGQLAPEFPSNMALAVTHADGTGSATIEVWTSQQSQTLGCDEKHACSIVVEPNYGGDGMGLAAFGGTAGGCEDHTYDAESNPFQTYYEATDQVQELTDLDNTVSTEGGQCSWTHRTVVPLSFAPTPTDCPAGTAQFKAQGLEMAARLVQQWQSGFCAGSAPLSFQYTSTGGEPQARSEFLAGSGPDVALTAYPDDSPAPRPYVYTPLADSAIVVAFYIDDPTTGVQITTLNLDARLLAKLLTQSYVGTNYGYANTVLGNPQCLFADPEFLALNPPGSGQQIHWPACVDNMPDIPIVEGGTTDLTEQVTTWIADDPSAQAFLSGKADPWGMHVNTAYEKPHFAGYPVQSFVPQDSSNLLDPTHDTVLTKDFKEFEFVPALGGLDQVARDMQSLQSTTENSTLDPTTGMHDKVPPQIPGERDLLAVLDAGEASALGLPVANLQNPAGDLVAPTSDNVARTVDDMATDPKTGVQQLPYAEPGSTGFATDDNAYPLTTVQYAMVPTQGASKAKASAIAQFLQQATGAKAGQVPGFQPGQLAQGYEPLTSDQEKQAAVAACDVRKQTGVKPGNQTASDPVCDPGAPGSSSTSGGAAGGSGSSGASGATGTTGADGGSDGVTGGTAGSLTGGTASGGTTGGSPAAAGATGVSATGSPSASAGSSSAPQAIVAGSPAADRVGGQRLLLPVLLGAGGVLLLGGPATLLLGGTDAGARVGSWGRRLRKLVRRG